MDQFELQGKEFVELNNLLKIKGLCSTGGQAKVMIAEGMVQVDGVVELRKRCKIRAGQTVEFESRKVIVK